MTLILVGVLAILALILIRIFGKKKIDKRRYFKSPELNEVEVVKTLTKLETDVDWIKKLVWFIIMTILGILIKFVYETYLLLPKNRGIAKSRNRSPQHNHARFYGKIKVLICSLCGFIYKLRFVPRIIQYTIDSLLSKIISDLYYNQKFEVE
jgi:hypothetical protein